MLSADSLCSADDASGAEKREQPEDPGVPSAALELAGAQLIDLVELVEAHLDRIASEKSPAAAYLEQLAPGSQKAMREALATLVSVACGIARSSATGEAAGGWGRKQSHLRDPPQD